MFRAGQRANGADYEIQPPFAPGQRNPATKYSAFPPALQPAPAIAVPECSLMTVINVLLEEDVPKWMVHGRSRGLLRLRLRNCPMIDMDSRAPSYQPITRLHDFMRVILRNVISDSNLRMGVKDHCLNLQNYETAGQSNRKILLEMLSIKFSIFPLRCSRCCPRYSKSTRCPKLGQSLIGLCVHCCRTWSPLNRYVCVSWAEFLLFRRF